MFELSNSHSSISIKDIKSKFFFVQDPIEACRDSHALVICTEWDEFKVLKKFHFHLNFADNILFKLQAYDYKKIYEIMLKPASIFDGRLILNHEHLRRVGFHVEAIGKTFK